MSKKHFPRKGDKVNDSRRIPHANGVITALLWSEDGLEEVAVRFDNGPELYEYSEFEFTWTDKYGGTFILAEEKWS